MNVDFNDLFGIGATQDSNSVSISKADFGLVPLSVNPAEAILAALLIKATEVFQGDLVDTDGQEVLDEVGESIFYDQSPLYPLFEVSFWQNQVWFRGTNQYLGYTWLVDFWVAPPPGYGSALPVNLLPTS